jgi:Tol biopolymer transport system component
MILPKILHYLNANFEYLMALNVFFLVGMGGMMLLVRLRNIRLRHLQMVLQQTLYYLVVVGETILLGMTVYVFVINLQPKTALDLTAHIYSNTRWVAQPLRVYFIENNKLVSIMTDGADKQVVVSAQDPIREYQFSPDGKHIIILTDNELLLLQRYPLAMIQVASLELAPGRKDIEGVINGVAWSPDSQRFCYRVSRWSKFSSQDIWMIYDILTQDKRSVKNLSQKIHTLVWAKNGHALYHTWFDSLDPQHYANPYEVKVYRIPLETLTPELVDRFPFHQAIIPEENLALRGVYLFTEGGKLAFGRSHQKEDAMTSVHGAKVGIDEEDTLFYLKRRWWRKRLYRVPRVEPHTDFVHYQYRGGDLAVRNLRWLPSGRQVIMEHYLFGILIMDPESGNIGILATEKGNTFGWYSPQSMSL